jgi:hypothetical protein
MHLADCAAMSDRPYRVGEIVLMEYQGWLKAFRVVGAQIEGDIIEYTLSMLELENQWKRPARG